MGESELKLAKSEEMLVVRGGADDGRPSAGTLGV